MRTQHVQFIVIYDCDKDNKNTKVMMLRNNDKTVSIKKYEIMKSKPHLLGATRLTINRNELNLVPNSTILMVTQTK